MALLKMPFKKGHFEKGHFVKGVRRAFLRVQKGREERVGWWEISVSWHPTYPTLVDTTGPKKVILMVNAGVVINNFCIVIQVGIYNEIKTRPLENSSGFALGISLGLRLYFIVYTSSCHNTDTISAQNFKKNLSIVF